MVALALIAGAALPALAQRGGPPPAGVQRPTPQPVAPLLGYKDPELATVLGLMVPGGGQIYAGRTTKGAVLLSVSIAAPVIGILGAMAMDDHRGRIGRFNQSPNRLLDQDPMLAAAGFQQPRLDDRRGNNNQWAPIAAGFGVSVASWVYGWATAASDARQHNQDRGFPRIGLLIQPLGSGRTGLGLSVAAP
jgi:hypothetical protein